MKYIGILMGLLLWPAACMAPPTYGPYPTGGGGLSSNEVYAIALSIGGPTNGISAATATNIVNNNNAASATWATNVHNVDTSITAAGLATTNPLIYMDGFSSNRYIIVNKDVLPESYYYMRYDLDANTLVFGTPPIADGQNFTNIQLAGVTGLEDALDYLTNNSGVDEATVAAIMSTNNAASATTATTATTASAVTAAVTNAWQNYTGSISNSLYHLTLHTNDYYWILYGAINPEAEEEYGQLFVGYPLVSATDAALGHRSIKVSDTNNSTAIVFSGIAKYPVLTEIYLENQNGAGDRLGNLTVGVDTNGTSFYASPGAFRIIDSGSAYPHRDLMHINPTNFVVTLSNMVATGSITGNGSGITNINAANISGDLTLDSLTATTLNVDAINGNGAGITNSPYALFHETLANNVASRFIAPVAWTNVIFTTNSFNSDTAGAFTQSNSFLIVNAAGAGTWKVRGNVVIYNNSGNTGSVTPRLYRWTDSSTLIAGLTAYQYGYVAVGAAVVGVVTLTAGDILGLQVFAANTTTTTVGRQQNSGIDASSAYIEFERR